MPKGKWNTYMKSLSPGDIFGKWTIIKPDCGKRRKNFISLCRCECGNEKLLLTYTVIKGKSTRCKECTKFKVGDKVGKWTIVETGLTDKKHKISVCECACGTKRIIHDSRLYNGYTTNCGCVEKKLSFGIGARNSILGTYKRNARNRNLIWNLNDDQVFEVFKRECYFCGAPPSNMASKKGYNGDYLYNGLDRLDNSRGYELDNVVSCCWVCNKMKGSLKLDVFLDQCKIISDRFRK